jgi:putative nucleotidyltransferase with HDIG domain
MSDEELQQIDVLDSNYPLMTLLREKAPGTYAHGKNVAALLEALGAELNLDVQKLRIAGFYHDIGKTVDPQYFSENQNEESENIHDDLLPRISYKIIVSHVAETTQILINDENIPIDVIRWCAQHHGNTVLKYFFAKAGTNNESSYRYHTKIPSSLEAGLLMICDCLEAKCRSLYQNDKLSSIEDVVDSTLNDLIDDQQLDDISLPRLSYLRKMKIVLYRELGSMYKPKRIDYPEVDKGEDKGSN